MKVVFTARHASLSPEVRKFFDKRIRPMERVLESNAQVELIVSGQKNRHQVEIHVKSRNTGAVVVEEGHDILNTVSLALDSLEKKIRREKEKSREKRRRKGRDQKVSLAVAEPEEEAQRVIRSDDYSLKPMSVEEAILHLNMKKRQVFVFRRLGSEKWTVVYRRKDGHIGLVEPE